MKLVRYDASNIVINISGEEPKGTSQSSQRLSCLAGIYRSWRYDSQWFENWAMQFEGLEMKIMQSEPLRKRL
jgi:hypothetical protein